jgi:D-alanyl-D-alanine carboxypeptidase/D-alanyl-D-alanine-endopeptidase (penicillin-binding protein 4)
MLKKLTLLLFSSLLFSCVSLKKHYLNTVGTQNHTGALIFNQNKGKVVFQHNSEAHFIPASTLKLVPALITKQVHPDHIPLVLYNTQGDSLHLKPTGDPTLWHPKLHQNQFDSILEAHEHLIIHLNDKETVSPYAPGWSWDDYDRYYSAELSIMPIAGNQVYINPLDSLNSNVYPDFFKDNVRVEAEVPKFRRAKTKNEFVIAASQKDSLSIPFIYNKIDLSGLISALGAKDVQITTESEMTTTWTTLKGIESDSIIKYMLEKSDNFLAEQMLLLNSKHLYNSFEIDSLIQNQKKELGIKGRWVDGSGLSRYNLISPKELTQVLIQLKKENSLAYIQKILPKRTLNIDNTTVHFYGKTGSMSGVYNYVGLVQTKKKNEVFFALFQNNALEGRVLRRRLNAYLKWVYLHF